MLDVDIHGLLDGLIFLNYKCEKILCALIVNHCRINHLDEILFLHTEEESKQNRNARYFEKQFDEH